MVGIFKTNIGTDQEKLKVISAIRNEFDVHSCSIDIEDCDKVLRVVAQDTPVASDAIIFLLQSMGFQCDILD
jgi:tRNA G26 N,N-dimethylase Trm1